MSKSKQFLFWIVAAVVATAGLGATLVWEHSGSRHSMYVVGVAEKGAALFFGEKNCSICHAVHGKGGRLAPDLGAIHPAAPAMGWLTTVLWDHAPGMWRQMRGRKAPQLNQEEMAHILAYLYQVGTADAAGDARAGAKVFDEKGCVRCHAVRGTGGTRGPDLAKVASAGDGVVWMGAMWNHAQSMQAPVTKELGGWPQFQGAEMNNLMAYVTGGAPGPGRELRGTGEKGWQVFQKKCIQCHAVRGTGGHVGPELGPDHELPRTLAQFAAVLWNHAPAMIRQAEAAGIESPTLQGEEITDVARFLVSLRYVEPAGSAFVGERIFAERGCARCHGAKAEGTAEAPPLKTRDAFTTVSLATSLWRHGPAMQLRAESLGIPWPTLEPADIGNLISFLNEPRRGK
jgi:mono/diheme cytochrome c family protein